MQNILPSLEVKARRVGGATYQVPIEIRPERRQTLALRWLVEFSRKRGEKTMAERLCAEIIDASNNTGAAVKRKEEMHTYGRGQQGVCSLSLVISVRSCEAPRRRQPEQKGDSTCPETMN